MTMMVRARDDLNHSNLQFGRDAHTHTPTHTIRSLCMFASFVSMVYQCLQALYL